MSSTSRAFRYGAPRELVGGALDLAADKVRAAACDLEVLLLALVALLRALRRRERERAWVVHDAHEYALDAVLHHVRVAAGSAREPPA